MKSPNILSDIVPVNNDQTLGTVWSPFKEGYFNKIIMSSGAGTNYDYDGSSNYTSMDLAEEEIKGAPAPSPWASPENFFISGGSPGYWNRSDAGNRPGGHLGIRSGRNSYIEKSDGTFAETASKPGIGFYVSKFGNDHPAATGTPEIKFYGYDEIAVMDNNSIRVDRPLIPYTNEKTNIGDSSHKFNEAYIKNVKGNADTASKLKTAVSLTTTDGTNTSAGVNFDGSDGVSIKLPSTIKATFSGNLTGDVTGNAASATKATQDGLGNVIADVYATKVELGAKNVGIAAATGSGNAITSLSADGNVITPNKGATFLTSLPDHSHNYAGSSSAGGPATSSQALNGFGMVSSQGWGVQTGTFVHGEEIDGCSWGFRKNCPNSGKVSLVVDGTFYQNEGQYACIDTSGGTISGNLSVSGTITGGTVKGAVFNDLADAIPVGEGDVLEAGYCYGFDGEHYTKTSDYLQKSYIGIHSDTFGFLMGNEEGKEKFNVAVSGFVLAYVDKEYEVGTPLTCTADGYLTEIKFEDKIKYPERIVATYWKNEPNEEWGPENKKVRVNGRKWVKVK